ncbi:MAG TPA: phosphoglucosamine mutase [Opitutaceae bacterium]|nr:phosphoglucosamine mutase [Opitutaceae bacterium]
MKREFFGTDGVRGRVGGPVINPAFFRRLAFAAGKTMHPAGVSAPLAVIGRDTRASGESLEVAVCEGLLAAGWNVSLLGVLPTPAVALAARESGAALGVVLTASHNPAADNGIKFFNATGTKLDDLTELRIESILPADDLASAVATGVASRATSAGDAYVRRMISLLPAGCLAGWRIGFDGANGATCGTTPFVLRALGAEVVSIGCEPDGTNINSGVGSENPAALGALVKTSGSRLGVAHDGDGDRLVLCDETGSVLDGDEILTFLACHALERGTLTGGKLVVTVQSNLGVDAAVRRAGGSVVRCDVGDRYVTDAMEREGAVIGGESSGHLVFSQVSPTGDGLIGALESIRVMIESGRPLSELRRRLVRFPQRTEAIRVREKQPIEACATLTAAIQNAEAALSDRGRVLVRYSGTEPKIRLLVEGPDESEVALWMDRLREAVGRDLQKVD